MASMAPVKSPALHNFSLPRLKWNKDNHNHNHSNGRGRRRRCSIKSPSCESHSSSGSPLREPPRQSPLRNSALAILVQSQQAESSPVCDDLMKHSPLRGESPLRYSVRQYPMSGDSVKQSPKHNLALESEASRTNKSILMYHGNHVRDSATENNRNGLYVTILDRAIQKSEKKRKAGGTDASAKRSRILRENESVENQQEELQKINNNLDDDGDVNDEEGNMHNNEEEPKTWNLRPRKPICKSLNGLTGKINGSAMEDKKTHSLLRNSSNRLGENEANGGCGQKKEKRKLSLWIALSKEEIEEDVFILTGSKPTRRPKKREKNIQKHLDCLFPGLWIVCASLPKFSLAFEDIQSKEGTRHCSG
ncbi:unnamed protein product [Fraxinus pennsylvanica]|uniref:Uncharacterized protein n=1 Tax=Fraxinus pennsylvanica TaxID=56036 RepID=A0AAD1Z935_9LAMI|nr:unnamed protein product [Fraxinus pennsylvanica]